MEQGLIEVGLRPRRTQVEEVDQFQCGWVVTGGGDPGRVIEAHGTGGLAGE
jgi:hypothetical protein